LRLESQKFKKKRILLIILTAAAAAVLVTAGIFFLRSPVLIVTEQAFITFYGEGRIRRETILASLELFRPVRNVFVANDAGDDLVSLAVSEASANPFSVIFPLRFAQAARIYREDNPRTRVIVLEGRFPEYADPSGFAIGRDNPDFFVFRTDIAGDFYRAGLAAAAIDNGRNGTIGVFVSSRFEHEVRDKFLLGVNDFVPRTGPSAEARRRELSDDPFALEVEEEQEMDARTHPQAVFYTTYILLHYPDLTSVVVADVGIEHIERGLDLPVIFFTWLNPALVPDNVMIIVNDSSWAQAVRAVRMAASGVTKGNIGSNFYFRNADNINRRTLRKIEGSR